MATFLSDTFTEASDTALGSHSPETGGTWLLHSTSTQAMTVIASEDRVTGDHATSTSVWYNDAVPGSEEYDVEGVIRLSNGDTNLFPGLIARAQSGSATCYQAYYNDGFGIHFDRISNGSGLSLGTHSVTLSVGVDYTLKIEIRNAAKKVYLDGIEILSSANNDITDAGFAGIRSRLGGRVDSLVVDDTTAAGTDATATPSGVSGTGSVGTVVAFDKQTITPTGVSATGAVGSVTAVSDVSPSVTGVSGTGQVGSVVTTFSGAAAVTGVEGTGGVGSVTVGTSAAQVVAVTGVSAAGQVGSPTITLTATVSVEGVSAVGRVGSVGVNGEFPEPSNDQFTGLLVNVGRMKA